MKMKTSQRSVSDSIPTDKVFNGMKVGKFIHFLDSGAFTLWTAAKIYASRTGKPELNFYSTKKFWRVIEDYACFIKKYHRTIDLYSNLDAIPHSHLTYRNQKYLENDHKLTPIPVLHYPNDPEILNKHYPDYEMVSLGGLVGVQGTQAATDWLDNVFRVICNTPNKLPRCKVHGFGVTPFKYFLRYPFWSVDTTAWQQYGSYGSIFVPKYRKGEWDFTTEPFDIVVSAAENRPASKMDFGRLSIPEKKIVLKWLDYLEIPFGEGYKPDIKKYGVCNRHSERKAAILKYFQLVCQALPAYPWAFNIPKTKGFY